MKINNEIKNLLKNKNGQINLITNNNTISKDNKILNQIRNSSFEILRIILMFLIILSHIKYHGKSIPSMNSKNYKQITIYFC
jgi:hypothetical protein